MTPHDRKSSTLALAQTLGMCERPQSQPVFHQNHDEVNTTGFQYNQEHLPRRATWLQKV